MKRSVKFLLITLAFILTLSGVRVLWIKNISPQMYEGDAKAGILDLTSLESKESLYPLMGEWLYYHDELLTADEIKNNMYKDQVAVYPQDWLKQSSLKDYNYGTFYMQLSLADHLLGRSLSIHVPNARLASKLYVNGELLGNSGNPASTPSEFKASMSPYVVHFYTEESSIDLVLHVSNDGTSPPVSLSPLVFGTTDSIQKNQTFSTISKLIVITVFIIIFLFSLFIYIFSKKKQRKTILYFSILIVFLTLTVLLDYDRVLLLDLSFSYNVKSKILRITYVLSALFAFLYFRHFLTKYNLSKLYNYYPYANLLYIVFLTFAPLELIDKSGVFLVVIFIVPLMYFVVKIFNAVRYEEEYVILLLLMGLSMLHNLFWSIYKTYTDTLTFEYYPLDALIAVVLFLLYWLRKHISYTEEIEVLTEELILQDKSKDDFLTQTSHELRNPLHSIINITQLVIDNPKNKLVKEDEESLQLLLATGKRMSLLVDDLLDFTLISERRLRLNKSPVDMRSIAITVIDMLDYLAKPKGIVIQNEISEDFPPVYADEARVIQLMLNIVHNAIKYTDEGTIKITSRVINDDASIRVRDTGRGMSPEEVKNIFKPFIKGKDVEGIGLGLPVTKELVELHGGKIELWSRPNEGTSIRFTLALAKNSSALAEHKLSIEELAASSIENLADENIEEEKASEKNVEQFRARILLVDDDQVNVEVLARMLRADHYEIVTALSGKEALQEIQKSPFDLVISDVMMPHMSGYELVKEIRRTYDLSELPIILLTARGKTEDLKAGFRAGANDYLIKPVDALELKARVGALTDLQDAVKAQLKSEAAWLQAQINPHFLYNTINSIIMMSKSNPEKMQYLLEKFVFFLRSSYDFYNKQSLITLQDELKLIDAYLSIEKERFGERLEIVWAIDESLELFIPPLSLQTLVENALKHGILNRIEGGVITLLSIETNDYINIIIQDDGPGMSEQLIQQIQQHKPLKEGGIGLINTDKRLRRWLQTSLIIESEPNKGTKVILPIKRK